MIDTWKESGIAPPPLAPPEPAQAPAAAAAMEILFGQLLAAPQAQRRRLLADALRQPGLDSPEFQARFEDDLPMVLNRDFDRLQPLIEVFSRHCGWNAGLYRPDGSGQSIGRLLERNAARLWRMEKENTSSRQTHPLREALQLLRGPMDQQAFLRFARRGANFRGMQQLLGQIREECPAAARHEVAPEALKWWTQHCATRDPPEFSWATVGRIGVSVVLLLILAALKVGIHEAGQPHEAPPKPNNSQSTDDPLVPQVGEIYVVHWPDDYARTLDRAVASQVQRPAQGPAPRGEVGLRIRMHRDGTVVEAGVDASSGQAALDAEALAVVRRVGRFAPVPPKYYPDKDLFNFHQAVRFSSARS